MKKLIFAVIFLLSQNCIAAQSAKITGYTYQHNFRAGETINFTVNIKNTGDAIDSSSYIYAQVILTNSATGQAVYPGGATASTSLPTGETFTSATSWTALAGRYSVTMVVYAWDGSAEVELTREYGRSVRVESVSKKETLKVFPGIINFGVLPYGRYMNPVPLEITYDFFLYNIHREQKPWYIRIYTDNAAAFKGIRNSIYTASPAGLVSSDGHYAIPLRIWCLNHPPADQEMGWDGALSGPPPVDDDAYWKGPILDDGKNYADKAAWLRIPDYSEMTADRTTWRTLIGQDIYDRQYKTDVNPSGDFTLKNPFSVYFATETSRTSAKGNYSCNLIIETYSP